MRSSLQYLDVPVLMSRGFTHGISTDILWGEDKKGQEYQVLVDGQFLLFGKRRPSGGVDSHKRMLRSTFDRDFK